MVTSPVQFVMVIVVLFVLGGPMVVFSIILREVIQDDGPPPWSPNCNLGAMAASGFFVVLNCAFDPSFDYAFNFCLLL